MKPEKPVDKKKKYLVSRRSVTFGISVAPLKRQMKEEKENLGALTKAERKCIGMLCLTVALWMTQPLHGYHPTVPALLAVVLMGMPKVGFIDWKNLVKVNFDMVLLIGPFGRLDSCGI
ncbi:anion permease [Salicibibacter cibi]|uniref:Anion permease n=1 Tax=Salicibibacter cibi TaxID=2743001 RepID=A0A7T6ZDB7_9BACI|nr:anion permease [Salicibibacter cibi]QQK81292.1 anion permease [Salicibibacter cibi]